MPERHTVLCPVDFSDASRGALRYARALAEYLKAELMVATVADPLLTEAAELASSSHKVLEAVHKELKTFYDEAFGPGTTHEAIRFEISSGKPAVEILRLAKEQRADLIVMSTHGLTGVRKLFFGSTTERVLRETTVPVLLTPASDPGPVRFEDVKRTVRRVLVPVDQTPATLDQVAFARTIATTLDVPVLLTFVVEPVRFAVSGLPHLPNIDAERRFRAEKALAELAATVPDRLRPEALVVHGDPAEEIAKIARDRGAGLIVIGLHASSVLGPRMGSVTYRVVCLTSTLVLALPPGATVAGTRASAEEAAQV
jgi:nucleotide-binding universal stress UspA family protein